MTRLGEIVALEEELREIDVAPPPRPSTVGKVAARVHDGARKRRSSRSAMTRALEEIDELEGELRDIDVELPPRPTEMDTAFGKHDGHRRRRSAEEKYLRKLRQLCIQRHLASPPARAPRGSTTSGGRRQKFRAAEARAAVELEEAVREAERRGCVERREVDPSDPRFARAVDSSPLDSGGSANGGVLYDGGFEPFYESGRKSAEGKEHTLHTERTLRGAYRLVPNYGAGDLHAIELIVKSEHTRHDKETVAVRVVFERAAGGGGGGRAMCRSEHLILEIRGLVVEVETSHPAFNCCILADYDTIMHSTPHIPRELTADGTQLLESTVPVLKLVCYTQALLSSVLRSDYCAHVSSCRNEILDAKATELSAVDALLPSTATSSAERADTVRDNYLKAARRTKEALGPTTTKDDTSDTVYKPDGWAIRGQGATPMYLRSCTFDASEEQVWSETAEMAAAQGAMLGNAAAALARSFPDALMAGFQAGGGHRWEGRFTYPTVALQAAGRAEAQSTPLWMRALHATQVGTHWAGPLPGANRKKEQFWPTARHLDKGGVKAMDLLKEMERAGAKPKVARCGLGQAIILYVACPPGAVPVVTRGMKRARGGFADAVPTQDPRAEPAYDSARVAAPASAEQTSRAAAGPAISTGVAASDAGGSAGGAEQKAAARAAAEKAAAEEVDRQRESSAGEGSSRSSGAEAAGGLAAAADVPIKVEGASPSLPPRPPLMDDVRFYFTYYDKHLSAPFDAKDFDRLHKFYLRPRHKMDRRGGTKTIPRRMCRNHHGSLYRILEDLRLRALRDLGDEQLARPVQYVYLLAYEEYLKVGTLRRHPAFWVSANENLTGGAEERIEIDDLEDEAAVPSDAVELGGSGSDDDADPPASPVVRVKTEQ